MYENIQLDENETTNFPRYKNLNIENFEYYTVDKFNAKFNNNMENDLKVININVRGLSKNYDNVTMYLSNLEQKFDVIIMTECHITKDIINQDLHNMYALEGYNMFYAKSEIKFGGVVVYSKIATVHLMYTN